MISIIAAIGKNRELGKDNALVFHVKEDMRFFKETTTGHPVIMGLKTFDSIGRPLPGRENFVAEFPDEPVHEGTTPVHDLISFLKEHQGDTKEYFVIGGATIYRLALPFASRLYLTEIEAGAEADAFFPEFDKNQYEREVLKEGEEGDLEYNFVKYTLKKGGK